MGQTEGVRELWTAGEGFEWYLDGDTIHLRPVARRSSITGSITLTLPDAAQVVVTSHHDDLTKESGRGT